MGYPSFDRLVKEANAAKTEPDLSNTIHIVEGINCPVEIFRTIEEPMVFKVNDFDNTKSQHN